MTSRDPLAGWSAAVDAAADVFQAWCQHAGPDAVAELESRCEAAERADLSAWPRHAVANALAALMLAEFASRDGTACPPARDGMTWPEILTFARARVGFCESCELPNGDVDRWARSVTCAWCGEPEVFGTYAAFGARAIVEIRNAYHGAEW